MNKTIFPLLVLLLLQGCTQDKVQKGFQVKEISENEEGEKVVGLPIEALEFETQPRSVLLTKNLEHRLVPIYKVNYDRNGKRFSGSNTYHRRWNELPPGNNWNNNFMPGFEALYGYNLINISHFDHSKEMQNEFFDQPVLIKTLYFPAASNDTLNFNPVVRDYYMVSVFDEDTNKDGYITVRDLRRLYLFDLHGKMSRPLVPKTYAVMSSEYDPEKDFMYVFAKLDQNENGQMELAEPTHVFWIDLKEPQRSGVLYTNQTVSK